MADERSELELEIQQLVTMQRESPDMGPEWQRAVSESIAWSRARLALLDERAGQQKSDAALTERRYSDREF